MQAGEELIRSHSQQEQMGINNVATVAVDSRGVLYAQSQTDDYRYRGTELEAYNVLEFFVDMYEDNLPKVSGERRDSRPHHTKLRGRPAHARVPYLPSHPQHQKKQRVVRPHHHRILPNIVGRWFPKRDPTLPQHAYYCASMLMLLKPWRSLDDLKPHGQTWVQAFDDFYEQAPAAFKRVMSGNPAIVSRESVNDVVVVIRDRIFSPVSRGSAGHFFG